MKRYKYCDVQPAAEKQLFFFQELNPAIFRILDRLAIVTLSRIELGESLQELEQQGGDALNMVNTIRTFAPNLANSDRIHYESLSPMHNAAVVFRRQRRFLVFRRYLLIWGGLVPLSDTRH